MGIMREIFIVSHTTTYYIQKYIPSTLKKNNSCCLEVVTHLYLSLWKFFTGFITRLSLSLRNAVSFNVPLNLSILWNIRSLLCHHSLIDESFTLHVNVTLAPAIELYDKFKAGSCKNIPSVSSCIAENRSGLPIYSIYPTNPENWLTVWHSKCVNHFPWYSNLLMYTSV